jgi:long-chain acyl-CoA synthetase
MDQLSLAFMPTSKLQSYDRIAIMMPNVLAVPGRCGRRFFGFVVVNVNPLYTPRVEHQLMTLVCKAIVIIENFAHIAEQCIADAGQTCGVVRHGSA